MVDVENVRGIGPGVAARREDFSSPLEVAPCRSELNQLYPSRMARNNEQGTVARGECVSQLKQS